VRTHRDATAVGATAAAAAAAAAADPTTDTNATIAMEIYWRCRRGAAAARSRRAHDAQRRQCGASLHQEELPLYCVGWSVATRNSQPTGCRGSSSGEWASDSLFELNIAAQRV
jgi:hypothetical protein